MSKSLKPVALLVAAVIALALAMGTSSFAAPAAKAGTGQIKQIVKKQIAKAAPNLSVAKAKNADTATTAANATNAANAQALGGKSLAQVKTVIAGGQDSSVVNAITGTGIETVTVPYTLAAPSQVQFAGTVELDGDGGLNDEARCSIRNDGSSVSLSYETSFDDINADNPSVDVVLTSVAAVPAGNHTATLFCFQNEGTGPITKDDAALNVIAVPN